MYETSHANQSRANLNPVGSAMLGGGGCGSATVMTGPCESLTVIGERVSYAEQNLSDIHGAIAVLEKRLETVLQPIPPATDCAGSAQTSGPPVSSLARRLMVLNDACREAVQRLQALTARVEV